MSWAVTEDAVVLPRGCQIKLSYHLIVTQRDRDEAVNQIIAAFLDARQLDPAFGREHSPCQIALPASAPKPSSGAKARRPSRRLEQDGLLLGERLVLIYVFALTAVILATYLWRHAG
jgi:hypothetical protein